MSFSEEQGIAQNAVCLHVEPPETRDDSHLAVATSVPIVITAFLLLLAFVYIKFQKRKNDNVWIVHEDELTFGDPVEILGRGSFGKVLLAKHRSTRVAAKRVLPPKEGSENRPSQSFDLRQSEIGRKHSLLNFGTSSWAGNSMEVSTGSFGLISGGPRNSEVAQWNRLKHEFIKEMRHISKLRHVSYLYR